MTTKSVREPKGNRESIFPLWFIFVFCLGVGIRLLAWYQTGIINPDGTLYIHQARALFYGQWERLTNCSMGYVSIYPIFITGAYYIFNDWIQAARAVSVFFGSITVIPVYFLLRQFFNNKTSTLTTLLFALIPVFVFRSADVVRGPIYWFFLALGVYFFILPMDKKEGGQFIPLSLICWLIAAWARVEALLYIPLSLFYLILFEKEGKLKKTFLFISPLIPALIAGFLLPDIFRSIIQETFRISQVYDKFFAPFSAYGSLREILAELSHRNETLLSPFFIHKVRNLVWLIALGTTIKYLIKAIFYPFVLPFVIGIWQLPKIMKKDRRVLYLVLLSLSAFILLYLHVLEHWIIAARFFALLLIPSVVFFAFGLEKVIDLLKTKMRLRRSVGIVVVSILLMALVLPKEIKPRDMDKQVFRNIGEMIAAREGHSREIRIIASGHSIRWVSFYANLNHKGAPCPHTNIASIKLMGEETDTFIRTLEKEGVDYVLWEENHWPQASDFVERMNKNKYRKIGQWFHKDTGKMLLFRRMS